MSKVGSLLEVVAIKFVFSLNLIHVDNAFSMHSSELTKNYFPFQVKEMSSTRN